MHNELDLPEASGFMMINNVNLSSRPPALRGEEDYLHVVVQKLERAIEMAYQKELIPVICGDFALKALDIELFKGIYPVLARYPDLLILASGLMLDKRTGEIKERSLLDLVRTMNLCEIICPADEQAVEIFARGSILRLTVAGKGDFVVSRVDDPDNPERLLDSSEKLPVLSRITQEQAAGPSMVSVIDSEGVSQLTIESRSPIFIDTRFDINRQDDDFSSELAVKLNELFERTTEEQPDIEIDDQLKAIFKDLGTSSEAQRIIFDIQKHTETPA